MDAVQVANEVVDDLLFLNRDGVLCELDIKKNHDHFN